MQIAILCGGLATRLGELTKNIPKSMVEIKGKPFIKYQIEYLKKHKISDIVLCVGHLSDQIKDYLGDGKRFGVNIRYSYDKDKPLGPIGALKNAQSLLEDNFFTMYGDSYVFLDFKKVHSYFLSRNNLALMVVYKNFDKYDLSNVIIDQELVTNYGKTNSDAIYIDYGVSLFRKEVLEYIPKDLFYTTKDLYPDLIKQKELLAYEVDRRFYQIGTPSSLNEFKEFVDKNYKS